MDVCSLCLENVGSYDDRILVDSEKWNQQNINVLIDMHLWPMQKLKPLSWICGECGKTLVGFHKYYERIKSAQQDFLSVLRNQNETSEIDDHLLDSDASENLDCKNIVIQSTLNEGHQESHIIADHPLPTEFIIDEPYIKCETEDHFQGDSIELNKKRKRGRPAKNVVKTAEHKDPLMKINLNKKSSRCSKKLVSTEADTTKNDTLSRPAIINTSTLLDIEYNDSETEPEHHQEKETETIKKKNHRNLDEKTLQEYDQIIADNFKIFCNLCQMEIDNFLSLRRHFKTEHNQRGYARCCKRNFFTRSLLVDHIHVHLNPEYFKCIQCSKVFSDRSRLHCHKKLHEDDSKLDKCDICGKLFADKGALKKHAMTHSSQKLFPCKICGKFFTNSFILNHHIEAVHQNKFVQICDICGKSIRCPTAFASHMEKHEIKTTPISCDVCGLLLTNKEGLKRHKNSQHPEGGKREHTCHICSKVSPTQRALKSHIRSVHEQGFDFKCNLCEKSFKRPAVLREHMATHTGTALYTCLWCPRTFISNGNMYNHRKNAHPEEWEELKRQKYAGNMS